MTNEELHEIFNEELLNNLADDENRGCKAWIPDYPTSMDACMELLDELSENNVSWMIENYGKSGYRFIIIFDEERALAFRSDHICRAVYDGFMAWKEEQ